MTYFQVTPGQVVGSDHMNTAIRQGCNPFPTAAARDLAIPAPVNGMLSWLDDVKRVEVYGGGAWRTLTGNERWGSLTLPSPINNMAASAWTLSSTLTGSVSGGCTVSGGLVTVPVAGRYRLNLAMARSTGASGYYHSISPGSASSASHQFKFAGAQNSSAGTFGAELNGSITVTAAANDKFGLWSFCSVANISITYAHLQVEYLGPGTY